MMLINNFVGCLPLVLSGLFCLFWGCNLAAIQRDVRVVLLFVFVKYYTSCNDEEILLINPVVTSVDQHSVIDGSRAACKLCAAFFFFARWLTNRGNINLGRHINHKLPCTFHSVSTLCWIFSWKIFSLLYKLFSTQHVPPIKQLTRFVLIPFRFRYFYESYLKLTMEINENLSDTHCGWGKRRCERSSHNYSDNFTWNSGKPESKLFIKW